MMPVGTFLEDVDLSWLNCFLVDGQLNDLDGCIILVLWYRDCYVMVIISIFLRSQTVGVFCLNTIIQKLNSNCVGKRDTI